MLAIRRMAERQSREAGEKGARGMNSVEDDQAVCKLNMNDSGL